MEKKLERDIYLKELIGKSIHIVDSDNKANNGIKGKVIDETRNMIIIETAEKEKKLIKKQNTIRIITSKGQETVCGNLLEGRPEERIKKWLLRKKQK